MFTLVKATKSVGVSKSRSAVDGKAEIEHIKVFSTS